MCKSFRKKALPRRAARRVAALLLAFAFIVSGIPLPVWQILGTMMPDLARYMGGGEVSASPPQPQMPPDNIEWIKDVEWDYDPDTDDPMAKVTLSIRGDKIRAASDVIILLDRTNGMRAEQCINTEHYDAAPIPIKVSYQISANGVNWFDETDQWLIVNTTIHNFDNGDLHLVSMSVENYAETTASGQSVNYYRTVGGSISWGKQDWDDISQAPLALHNFIVTEMGYTEFLNRNNSYGSLIYNFAQGCIDPFDAGFAAAQELADSLLSEKDGSGNSVNNVAMLSFGTAPSSSVPNVLQEIAGFHHSEAYWSSLTPTSYPVAQGNYARYDYALVAAKYYFVKYGGYKIYVQDDINPSVYHEYDKDSIEIPDLDINNRQLEIAIDSNAQLLKILDNGILSGGPGDTAPYVIIISSVVPTTTVGFPDERKALHVNTQGIVMHNVGFEDSDHEEFMDFLQLISDGKNSSTSTDMDYLGHWISGNHLSTLVYDDTYKGNYYQIQTGKDLVDAFEQIPITMLYAGYNALITDVLEDGFDLLIPPVVNAPPGTTFNYTMRDLGAGIPNTIIEWWLDVISDDVQKLEFYIGPVNDDSATETNIGPIDNSIVKDDNGDLYINANKETLLEYYTNIEDKGPYEYDPQPKLDVVEIEYSVNYFRTDLDINSIPPIAPDDPPINPEVEQRAGIYPSVDPYMLFDSDLYNEDKYAGYTFIDPPFSSDEPGPTIPYTDSPLDVNMYFYKTGTPDKVIKFFVEYYKDGAFDPDETVPLEYEVRPWLNGFNWAANDPERLQFVVNKLFNGFTRISPANGGTTYQHSATSAEIPFLDTDPVPIVNGTIVKVYYESDPNVDDYIDVNIYKDVFNERGELISSTATADAYDYTRKFRIIVSGSEADTNGLYYRQNVYVSMADRNTMPPLKLPAGDIYTITEDIH
ncbi:MAG: hypothetical protein FWH01_17710, partial [Oscillospiraceae bacterium]|nr:hypothetical protein [Oscillospiraceae bacterium]